MPQLMPLIWISSSFMVLLLLMTFINLYFVSIFSELNFGNEMVLNKNYLMEW